MLPPRQHAGCAPASEDAILEQSRQHSRRLGKLAIDASNVVWRHDEAEREARHAFGAARREAFARLDALNASYDAEPAGSSVPASKMKARGRISASVVLAGTVASLLMFRVSIPADPTQTADDSTIRETMPAATVDAEAIRRAVETAACIVGAMRGDASACHGRVCLIHPVWRH